MCCPECSQHFETLIKLQSVCCFGIFPSSVSVYLKRKSDRSCYPKRVGTFPFKNISLYFQVYLVTKFILTRMEMLSLIWPCWICNQWVSKHSICFAWSHWTIKKLELGMVRRDVWKTELSVYVGFTKLSTYLWKSLLWYKDLLELLQ